MRAFGIVLIAVLLGACTGGRSGNEDDDDTTLRQGEDVPIEEQKYYDAKPSISADGTNVVFISGRDEQLKVYTFTEGDEESARLTDEDDETTDETDAAISPDGTLVGVIASKDDSIDLHFKSFDGSGSLITVEDEDGAIESQLSFSDDGALVTFVRRSTSSFGAEVYVGEIDGDGNITNLTLLSDDSYSEDSPRFVATGTAGTYKLVTTRQSSTEFIQQIWTRTITTGSGISVDEEAQLENAVGILRDTFFSGGFNKFYYGTKTASSGTFAAENWAPPGIVDTDETFAIQSQLAVVDVDADSTSKLAVGAGVNILGISASKVDGGVGLAVTRDVWSCVDDKFSYVTRVKIIDLADGELIEFTPYFAEGTEFTGIAEAICVSKPERNDNSIKSIAVNGDGTPDAFKAVFVTLYPAGDNEVKLLSFEDGTYTQTDVSQNQSE